MIKTTVLCILLAAVLACPDEINCRQCDKDGEKYKCADCYMGFIDQNYRCVVKEKSQRIDHCDTYQVPVKGEENKCKDCDFGFIQENGKCEQCKMADCAICGKKEECQACLSALRFDKIKNSCVKENIDVPNCQIRDYGAKEDRNACALCNDKFALNGKETDKTKLCVEDKIGNCQILNPQDLNKCGKCAKGYYISGDGKCFNDTRKGMTWIFWVVLAAIILAIPLIWFLIKRRRASHTDHYHTIPVPVNANTNLPYTQRLVN
jgi:hypothetical protein